MKKIFAEFVNYQSHAVDWPIVKHYVFPIITEVKLPFTRHKNAIQHVHKDYKNQTSHGINRVVG